MSLTLSYFGATSVPVEIEGLTPDKVRGESLAAIEKFQIFHGNEKIPLAEMFKVSGDPTDGRFDLEGDLAGVHWVGAHMREGVIHIHGNGGRHIGSEMRGGEIHVDGNASDWVGGEMRGGLIRVGGNAGHLVGAGYRGSRKGMTGGTILVGGNVGNELGHTMRRGWIAVGGQAGDMVGFNMIAGSIFVFGGCGIRAGAGMRRGTIGMFGGEVPQMLPSFRRACRYRPDVLPLMFRELARLGFTLDPALLDSLFDLWIGDLVAVGKGEILIRV